jgi:hypothetical protein
MSPDGTGGLYTGEGVGFGATFGTVNPQDVTAVPSHAQTMASAHGSLSG